MSDRIDSLFNATPEQPPQGLTIPELRIMLQRVANMIVAVGTGGQRIQSVEAEYLKLDRNINANFGRLGLQAPFPWRSLWEWYGFYSQELGTYRERREHIAGLTKLALDELNAAENTGIVHDPMPTDDTPTWERINTRVAGLIAEYSAAQDQDDWQDVGRRSREILVDLGKLIADPDLVPEGQEHPKLGDAKAWFDLLLAQLASGGSKAELRAVMRSTWELAQKVTHADIDDVDAFAAAQATVLLVRTSQKLLAVGGE